MKYSGYIYLNKLYVNNLLYCVYCGYHKYDGNTIDESYFGSGIIWNKKLNKYKKDDNSNITRIIVDRFSSKKEMNLKEKFWISFFKEHYGNLCVNIAEGGEGGCNYNYSEESYNSAIIKISNAKKSREKTEKEKKALDNLHEYNKGKHHSEESKEKSRQSNLGQKRSEETKYNLSINHANVNGDNNPAFGRHWYNNGIIQVFEKTAPDGFVKGKLKKNILYGEKNPVTNRHWYNNGEIEKYEYECPNGFVKGRLKSIFKK